MKKQSKIENYIQSIVWVGMIFFITSQMPKYTIETEFKIAAYVLLSIVSMYIILGPIWKEKSNLKNIQNAGMEGEQRVQDQLQLLNKDKYTVINSIYLRGTNLTQEFDSIVISDKGIFNIECKNFSGGISITRDGIWNRQKRNGSKDTLQNPTPQVLRHRKVLESIVGDVNIIDVIVISNDMVNIYGCENSSIQVVKYDRLLDFIDDCKAESKYNISDLYNKIAPKINGHSSITDYGEKHKKPFYKNIDCILRMVIFVVVIIILITKFNVSNDKPVSEGNINETPVSTNTDGVTKVKDDEVEEKQLNVETTALEGAANIKVNKCVKKGSKLTISGEVLNNATDEISIICDKFYLVDNEKKAYELDYFKNTDFNKDIPAGTKVDFNMVFTGIDSSKAPFEIKGEFFVMGHKYMQMNKGFSIKLQ